MDKDLKQLPKTWWTNGLNLTRRQHHGMLLSELSTCETWRDYKWVCSEICNILGRFGIHGDGTTDKATNWAWEDYASIMMGAMNREVKRAIKLEALEIKTTAHQGEAKLDAYWADPLYKAVKDAQTVEDMTKAVKTIRAIRGDSAWSLFMKCLHDTGKEKPITMY